jgi:nitrous oxidase accessory protein NosD
MARLRLLFVVAFACVASLLFASAAGAAVIVVHQGQSIQAAINAASPGDTIVVEPGIYHENLTITKNRLTLRSANGRGSVVLEPGAVPTPSDCNSDPFVEGICVHGEFTATGFGAPVNGTRIDGFVVAHFSDFGIILLNAADSTVTNTEGRNNGSYGISGFVLTGVRYVNNISHDNGDPGFYIGDSPHANAWVSGNRSWRNGVGGSEGFGFLFRDSSLGTVVNNSAWDNCAGFVFVDSGEDPAPFENWTAAGNTALHNNGACPGGGGPPPTSGIGFVLFGTQHVVLHDNTARDNRASGPTIPSGGIVVLSSKAVGGSDPMNNVVAHNTSLDNNPFDIFWDGSGSGNTFVQNNCKTSQPSWICGP